MPKTSAGLEFILSARGAVGVVKEIGRVGQGVQEAQRHTGRGAQGWQRWKSGIRQATGAARGLWNQMRGIAAMTGIGGAIGFASLAKEIMDAEDASIALRFQADKTKEEWVNIDAAIERMRSTTGKSKVELLNLLDVVGDFGVGFDDALASMEDLVAFAKLLRVDTAEAGKAVGAIAKATGGKVGSREGMAMLAAAAKAAGGDEGAFLGGASKTIRMMEGASAEDIQRVLQIQAGAGQEFMGQEDVVFKAMKSLETLSAKDKASMGDALGATGGETMLNLASLYRTEASKFEQIQMSDQVRLIAQAMGDNYQVVNDVGAAAHNARGKLDEFGAALQMAKDSTGPQWAGLMEDIKKAAEPMVREAFGWMLANKEQLVAAIQTAIETLRTLGAAALKVIEAFMAVWDFWASKVGSQTDVAAPTWDRVRVLAGEEAGRREADRLEKEGFYDPAAMAARSAAADAPRRRNAAVAGAISSTIGNPFALVAGVGNIVNNIRLVFSPETVHTQADAEVNGRRVPATVNAE